MVGTITTLSHCVVKDGVAYEGSREDIVSQVAKLRITEDRTVYITVAQYKEEYLQAYTDDWTPEELHKQIIKDAFTRLSRYGFRYYRNIL